MNFGSVDSSLLLRISDCTVIRTPEKMNITATPVTHHIIYNVNLLIFQSDLLANRAIMPHVKGVS
jgi:hypothetical protein